MTVYYVSASGNDASSGRSALLPWQTLAKVRAKMADGTITRRDVVLFRRGDTFTGRLNGIPTAGISPRRLIFGTYGDKPSRAVFDGYKYANSEAGWALHAPGVWECDLTGGVSSSGAYTGDTGAPSTDVGFLKVDGVIHGSKRFALGDLIDQWDFYSPGEDAVDPYVYVKSTTNPATLTAELAIAVDGPMLTPSSSTAYSGLEFVGGGGHGGFINAAGSVRFYDVAFREIGGCELDAFPGVRYGNGLEIGMGSSDVKGDIYCEDVYDVAFTCQGEQTGTSYGITDVDITLRDKNCTQSVEFWARGTDPGHAGAGLLSVRVHGGYSLNPGHSWGRFYRADAGRGCAILLYTSDLPYDVVHENRDIINPKDAYSYCSNTGNLPPSGFVSRNNRIHLPVGMKLQYQRAEEAADLAAWQEATGLEHGSQVFYLPGDPETVRDTITILSSFVGFGHAQRVQGDDWIGKIRSELASGVGLLTAVMDSTWARQAAINCLATPKANTGFTNITQNTAYWDGAIRDNGAGAQNDEVSVSRSRSPAAPTPLTSFTGPAPTEESTPCRSMVFRWLPWTATPPRPATSSAPSPRSRCRKTGCARSSSR